MKHSNLIILFIFPLLAFKCTKKESLTCHHNIIIRNNSANAIFWAINVGKDNKCILSGSEISANQQDSDKYSGCWEDKLADGQAEEIYIVDAKKFNSPKVFYDCDSIEIKNKVLKYVALTLEEARKNNFTITYP